MKGYLSASQASGIYAVRTRTIQSRIEHAQQFGGTGSPVPLGRRQILSPEVITQEKEKTRALDDKLRSRKKAAWASNFYNLQEELYTIGDPRRNRMDPDTVLHYRKLIAPEECKTYDQNEARTAALEEYSLIAWAAILRAFNGWLSCTGPLGREPGQESANRLPGNFYNIDGSSTFLGEELPVAACLAQGSRATLKNASRSGKIERKSDKPPIQRRSIHYMPIVSLDKLLAWVSIVKERNFAVSEIQLFRCPANKLHWMITEGSNANQYDLALRLFTEIVDVVTQEDQEDKKRQRAADGSHGDTATR